MNDLLSLLLAIKKYMNARTIKTQNILTHISKQTLYPDYAVVLLYKVWTKHNNSYLQTCRVKLEKKKVIL